VVERALTSSPAVVYDLHEAVGGMRRSGLSRSAFDEHHRGIARDLDEAFRNGRLVAYRWNPLPARSGVGKSSSRSEPERAPEQWPAEERENFITITLVGEDGLGIPNVRYRVVLPDKSVREGTLDGAGTATVRGKFSGQCKVTFPDLDTSAWDAA
jgi:hypothetical protein